MKPNNIIAVTDESIVTLVFTFMPFFFTNESRCFLYIFVFTNQLCNFSEEFAKQNTVSKKNYSDTAYSERYATDYYENDFFEFQVCSPWVIFCFENI